PPKVAVSKLVNSLKGVSARRIRQEFTSRINRAIMHGHLRSPPYFSASCGGAPLAIVRQYIEQQKRAHQRARQSSLEMHSSPA
ncbi:transposase, partial [Streptomyces sp. NPDC002265]|uniref:transposase n=1 Tax=Streptomyces sp. NPDC002265 TaxID=3154415 RepID=UPI0033284BFD